jgi:preprotein translocase subunit SecE
VSASKTNRMNVEPLKQPIVRSREFLEECWSELKKVAWPTRAETQAATIAVVVSVVIVALFLGLVDFVLSWLIGRILS